MEEKVDQIALAQGFWHKYLVQMIILVFVTGGGWVTLTNVKAMAEDNRARIEAATDTDDSMERRLIKMEVTQQQIRSEIQEQKQLTKEILQELRSPN